MPVIFGLSYLEKEPPRYECKESDGQWHECSKDHICKDNVAKDDYRPVETEPEYFDNWVSKFDLLCNKDFFFYALLFVFKNSDGNKTHLRRSRSTWTLF